MSFLLKSRLYCGTFWSSEDGSRGSSQVVVLVLWSTKYTRAVFVNRISHPLGRGPNCDTGCCWMVCCPWLAPYILIYCCLRGSTQVVVRVLWSTKYTRPSGVCLCSQPGGSSPVPAVVAPVASIDAACGPAGEADTACSGCEGTGVGEFAPVRSSATSKDRF